MSETRIAIGSMQNAMRVVLQRIEPNRGLGMARLRFTFEVASKQAEIAGCPIWIGGRVEVLHLPRHTMWHLAPFQPTSQPLILPQLGGEHSLQLTLDISDRQLQLIESRRTEGGLQFNISLSGYAMQNGQYVVIPDSQFTHNVSQSDWPGLLRDVGYGKFLLLELEVPDQEAHPELASAMDYFVQAQQRYAEGEPRLTVESLRQALAALVGKKADDEEQEADIEDAFKTLRKQSRDVRVAYEPRLEQVRKAAKFMADLGAHPETAETQRHHAYGALLMVGGLLHAYAVQPPSRK